MELPNKSVYGNKVFECIGRDKKLLSCLLSFDLYESYVRIDGVEHVRLPYFIVINTPWQEGTFSSLYLVEDYIPIDEFIERFINNFPQYDDMYGEPTIIFSYFKTQNTEDMNSYKFLGTEIYVLDNKYPHNNIFNSVHNTYKQLREKHLVKFKDGSNTITYCCIRNTRHLSLVELLYLQHSERYNKSEYKSKWEVFKTKFPNY